MLVLSRKRDQAVRIGKDIRVMVTDIRGDKVRIGTNAPPCYRVYRKEIYDGILREIAAGGSPPEERIKSGAGQLVLSRQRDEKLYVIDPADWNKPLVSITALRQTDRLTWTARRSIS